MSRAELIEWVEGLDESQLACRDLKHPWKYYTAAKKGRQYERTLKCRSCGSFKLQILTFQGLIVRTRYAYAEGYLRPKGFGRITRKENAMLRLATLNLDLEETS